MTDLERDADIVRIGPMSDDERAERAAFWLAECRARLADPRPAPAAAGDEDRNQ